MRGRPVTANRHSGSFRTCARGHHRDHNHRNNPADGGNWELLCLYCHDNEHETYREKALDDAPAPEDKSRPSPIATPFAGLDGLLGRKSG